MTLWTTEHGVHRAGFMVSQNSSHSFFLLLKDVLCMVYTTVNFTEKTYLALSFSVLNFITGFMACSVNKEVVLEVVGFPFNLIFFPIPAEKTKGV